MLPHIPTELCDDIRAVGAAVGQTPSHAEYERYGMYSQEMLTRRFGSFAAAVVYAGFDPLDTPQLPSRSALVAALTEHGDTDGMPPTVAEINTKSEYWASMYCARFGSWQNALDAADLPQPETTTPVQLTNEQLCIDLRRVVKTCGPTPTLEAVTTVSQLPPRIYSDRFGSWSEALTAAGIDASSCTQPAAIELGIDLRRLSAWLDRTPTKADVRDHGQYSVAAYRDAFGSWEAATTAVLSNSSQP